MAKVEIDENQLAGLQKTAQIVQQMLSHPKARPLLQQAEKAFNPNLAIPEIDAQAPILSEIEKVNKRLDEQEKAAREREEKAAKESAERTLRDTWGKGRGKLKSTGYTDEGIDKIEKLMEERGIADHDAAAALYDRLNPPAEPVASVQHRFNPFESRGDDEAKAMKMLLEGNEEGFLGSMIPQALADVRGTPTRR